MRSVELELRGAGGVGAVTGRLLTAPSTGAHNSEAEPDAVAPVALPEAAVVAMGEQRVRITLPPRSLVVLELRPTKLA